MGTKSTAPVIGVSPVWAATDDDTITRVGIIGKKRYQRLTIVGAATPVADFTAVAVLSHPLGPGPIPVQDNI